MKKIASTILIALLSSSVAVAADAYRQGKIVKWEKRSYAENSKETKNWIVYQLQTENTTYSIARHKENKPEMQIGESVQYELRKKNQINVIDARGRKREYQIVGQAAGPGQ